MINTLYHRPDPYLYGLISPTIEYDLNPSLPISSKDIFAASLAFDNGTDKFLTLYVSIPMFQTTGNYIL